MSDLTDWLREQIAADETAARAASQGPWRYNPSREWHTDSERLTAARAGRLVPGGKEFVCAGPRVDEIGVASTGASDDPQSMADAAHIARWDPTRVLAECAAKRRLLSRHEEDRHRAGWCSNCYTPTGDHRLWPCHVVLALAQSYADQPGFDPAWRIEMEDLTSASRP